MHEALLNAVKGMNFWTNQYNVQLNVNKCIVMHNGESGTMGSYFNAVAMPRCNIIKDPGTTFDAELKVSKYIDCATTKAYKAIFMIFLQN